MSKALREELRKHLAKIGRKGAAARNRNLTREQRQEIGRKAIQARWAKRKKKPEP